MRITTSIDDLREGSSTNTVATPEDFPEAYDYGLGTINGWSRDASLKRLPFPIGDQTVTNTKPDTSKIQSLYLRIQSTKQSPE